MNQTFSVSPSPDHATLTVVGAGPPDPAVAGSLADPEIDRFCDQWPDVARRVTPSFRRYERERWALQRQIEREGGEPLPEVFGGPVDPRLARLDAEYARGYERVFVGVNTLGFPQPRKRAPRRPRTKRRRVARKATADPDGEPPRSRPAGGAS